MSSSKVTWKSPAFFTVKTPEALTKIGVSACSTYSVGPECEMNTTYIDSFPGSKPEYM